MLQPVQTPNLFRADVNVADDGVVVDDIAAIVVGRVVVVIDYDLQELSTLRLVPRTSYIQEHGAVTHLTLREAFLPNQEPVHRGYLAAYDVQTTQLAKSGSDRLVPKMA